MAETCAQGAFGRIAIRSGTSPYTWASGTRLRYFRESIRYVGVIDVPDTINGTLQENSERARRGPGVYAGIVTFPVNPADMVTLLPLFMGGSPTGTSFPYAETVPTFGILIDKITDVFEYPNGVVNRILIHGKQTMPGQQQPNWLTMAVEMLFKDEVTGVEFPDLAYGTTAGYTDFVFEDSALTVLGSARKPKEFSLLIHRHQWARYVNSVKPTTFCPSRFSAILNARFPYDDDHDDLHNQALAGAAGSLAFTNGTISTTFNFGNLQAPPKTPDTPGKTEIDIDLTLVARKLGSTDAVAVVNDSTP